MQVIQDMGVNLVHGGADVNGYLQWASAAGVTGFDGSGPAETIVQLASWAVDHTVYEEYLHVLNGAERGCTANGSEEMVKEEIAVKRQVLGHADELGMSAAERIGMGQEIDRYLRILRDSAGLVPDDEC